MTCVVIPVENKSNMEISNLLRLGFHERLT